MEQLCHVDTSFWLLFWGENFSWDAHYLWIPDHHPVWKHIKLICVGKAVWERPPSKWGVCKNAARAHSGPQIKPRHSTVRGQRWVLWACHPQSGSIRELGQSQFLEKEYYRNHMCVQKHCPPPFLSPMAGKISCHFPRSLSELDIMWCSEGEDCFSCNTSPAKRGIHYSNEWWTFPTTVPFKLVAFRDLLVTVMS